MVSVQDINSTIISGALTNDQLESIISAIKFARAQQVHKNTGSMVKGTRVKFVNPKTHVRYTGVVNKVNRKYILVDTDVGVRYNVPANLLSLEN